MRDVALVVNITIHYSMHLKANSWCLRAVLKVADLFTDFTLSGRLFRGAGT